MLGRMDQVDTTRYSFHRSWVTSGMLGRITSDHSSSTMTSRLKKHFSMRRYGTTWCNPSGPKP